MTRVVEYIPLGSGVVDYTAMKLGVSTIRAHIGGLPCLLLCKTATGNSFIERPTEAQYNLYSGNKGTLGR